MKISITPKAKKAIANFTALENTTYSYLVELLKSDMEQISNCQKEIEVYENTDPKYKTAIKYALAGIFRTKYVLGCLKINANEDVKEMTILIDADKY